LLTRSRAISSIAKGIGTTSTTLERLNPGLSAITLPIEVRVCRPKHKGTTTTGSTKTATAPAPAPATNAGGRITEPSYPWRGLLAGLTGAVAGAALALMALLLLVRRRRPDDPAGDKPPSEDEAPGPAAESPTVDGSSARSKPRPTRAPAEVRALALPATFAFQQRTARTLTPLEPEGYVLLDEHVAVLATAVSGEHIERDQPVTLVHASTPSSRATTEPRSSEGLDA
jgi:hypothetical protein